MPYRPKRRPSLSHLLWALTVPDFVSPETSCLQALAPADPSTLSSPPVSINVSSSRRAGPCSPWHLSVDLVVGELGEVGRSQIPLGQADGGERGEASREPFWAIGVL